MASAIFPNPTNVLTHMECLSKLCLFCHGKYNLRSLSEELIKTIRKESIIENLEATHIPRSVCETCRKDLKRYGAELIKSRRTATQPSADSLVKIVLDGPCDCGLCKIVRTNAPPSRKKKPGRPAMEKNSLVCKKCFDENCDGKSCQKTTVKKRAAKLIENNPNVAQAVASQVIKTTEASPKGTIRLAQGSGGAELPLTLGSSAKKPKKVEVTSKEVNELQQKIGLGIKQTRQVTQFLNEKVGRGTVEKGHQETLAQMTHVVDGHFTLLEECQFMDSDKNLVQKPLVHCTDLSDFVFCVIDCRGYDRHSTEILFNVDNSENFSEYYITILNLDEDPNAPQKSSGSSHTLLVAVSPKVPENPYNFKKVLEIIKAHRVKMLYQCDLKADSSLVGIQSAACKHPCIYCNTDDLSKAGTPRTIGTICERHQAYLDSGLDKKHLKDYENCANFPLITDDYEGDKNKEILDLVPPPGLHMMLGIVNQKVKVLETVIPTLVDEWVKHSNAPRNAYHGGVFEGNGCKSLVDNVDYLEMLVLKDPAKRSPIVLSIIEVLRAFGKMRHSCYAKILQPDFEKRIDNYSAALDNAVSDHDVSIILKNHIAKFHVKTWCQRKQVGLGARSEQAPEASHKKFLKTWQKFAVTGPTLGKQLLRTACVFNSENCHFIITSIHCPHSAKNNQE